jgi:hypothetical protein
MGGCPNSIFKFSPATAGSNHQIGFPIPFFYGFITTKSGFVFLYLAFLGDDANLGKTRRNEKAFPGLWVHSFLHGVFYSSGAE